MSQTLSDTLAANTTYTLTVQQNLTALNMNTVGTWQIELLAADITLVSLSDSIASLERDTFVLRTLQYTTGSSVDDGQQLGIRFTLTGTPGTITDLAWDDVQLDRQPSTSDVNVDSLMVTRGTFVLGGVVELADSDNFDLSIQRAVADIQSRTEFEVKAVSPVASPSSLEVTLESSVFARSQVNQTIELFDYAAGAW